MSKCERSRRPSLARRRYLRSVVHGLGYHELTDGEAGGDGMAAAMSVVASNRVNARQYSFTPGSLVSSFLSLIWATFSERNTILSNRQPRSPRTRQPLPTS